MKIAIVENNKQIITIIKGILHDLEDFTISWIATDGEEAVKKCDSNLPHIILIGINLPKMDGVETTRQIMRKNPCYILLVDNTHKDNTSKLFKAIVYGAMDKIEISESKSCISSEEKALFLKKLATIGKLIRNSNGESHFDKAVNRKTESLPYLIVIGSSTGGPEALLTILSALPDSLNAAIVIVQHLHKDFSLNLAKWLDVESSIDVCEAKVGESPKKGSAYLARTNDHLVMTQNFTFRYTPNPKRLLFRPSVDVFFNSIEENWKKKGTAVLLSGMGNDGAKGLYGLKKAGWYTIAQDKETSAVYGMPGAAKKLNAASDILPSDEIANAIIRHL